VRGSEQTGLGALKGTFGEEKVADSARRQLVRDLFDRLAPRYDLMNDLMSMGLHRLWKRRTVAVAAMAARRVNGPVMDLAGGTGDLAQALARQLPGRLVVDIDGSPGMAAEAAKRGDAGFAIGVAVAEHLPLADAALATVSLSFGLRNMTDPQGALREVHRVLKPEGTLILLEFSKPYRWFAPLYDAYSRFVIPTLGAIVARDRRAYRYLIESIRLFPGADSMSEELRRAGFEVAKVRRFMLGVAALHVAVKP
jgi:demethylmenaquinone methyltransferase / 2-methoxy-6-polyprenyl-1,4-benzoquinol methylase